MVGYHSIVGIDSATNCQQLYLELHTVCHQLEPFPYHSMLFFIATLSRKCVLALCFLNNLNSGLNTGNPKMSGTLYWPSQSMAGTGKIAYCVRLNSSHGETG